MRTGPSVLASVMALLVAGPAGCGGEEAVPPGAVDAASAAPDAAVTPDAPPSALATVTGAITRSAQPMGDARGHVYVALFDRDPVVERDTAQVVARTLIEGADLSASGASVTYTLADVPPRAAAYYLVAFLDDNGNVNPASPDGAGPDRGDLVSLDGLASPRLAVATSGTTAHDVVLNSVLPF